MESIDIRWKQRLANYGKALENLVRAVQLAGTRPLSELERQGLIQSFEFTHELAWNVMKDWFEYQGNQEISGSRDASREAFARGLVKDGEAWMEMIKSRNQSSHTYNLETALEIASLIVNRYTAEFIAFKTEMERRSRQS